MAKRLFLLTTAIGFLFISCKGPQEHPGQVGNRNKLDIFHRQKQVR